MRIVHAEPRWSACRLPGCRRAVLENDDYEMSNWLSEFGQHFDKSIIDTLIAGAFGAFAGAVGAQVIISRGQNKQSLLSELNSVSAALMLSRSICNSFVSLKRQYVRPLQLAFEAANQQYERSLQTGQALQIRSDLETFYSPRTPTDALETLVFEKIALRGRGLASAVQLVGAIEALDKIIEQRNSLINDFRVAAPMTLQTYAAKYLGMRDAHGVTDDRYPATLRGLGVLTDDCIFFSQLLHSTRRGWIRR